MNNQTSYRNGTYNKLAQYKIDRKKEPLHKNYWKDAILEITGTFA
jgi:hypothetical protein